MSHEKYLFTEKHEWIEPEGDVRAVGITDHAQHLLGEIVYVELPEAGKRVTKGDVLLEVESPKMTAEVYAPLSGEIVAVNDSLGTQPENINKHPYTDGWLVKIKVSNVAAEAEGTLDWAAYQELIGG